MIQAPSVRSFRLGGLPGLFPNLFRVQTLSLRGPCGGFGRVRRVLGVLDFPLERLKLWLNGRGRAAYAPPLTPLLSLWLSLLITELGYLNFADDTSGE